MLITSPQSSSDSSTTPVVASCPKDYDIPVRRLVLAASHHSLGDGRPPMRKVGFNRTGGRENDGFFFDHREGKREKVAIPHRHHDPQQAHYQQEGYLSSNSSTFRSSDSLVLHVDSSSLTDGLKRLHECMARTTESRQLLVRAHAISSKDMVALCATTRKVLSGAIDLHGIVPAGYQDRPMSSNNSTASSIVVGRRQSSHESQSMTPSLSTIKRQRSVQTKQARRAMKEHKRATMSRTGVAFRPFMVGMLDC